jgi:hypothetical protein
MPFMKSFKFNFKTRTIRDEAGNAIGKSKKQPSVETSLPVLDGQDVINVLVANDPKINKLVLDAIDSIIVDAARGQFDEAIEALGDNGEVSASCLDFSKLTLEYLASIPASSRGAVALTDEDLETFYTDYIAVMVAATGKPEVKLKAHTDLFRKPLKCKANKPVLGLLVDQLDIYMSQSASIEDTGLAASRIRDKFQRWLDAEEATLSLDLL